MSIFHELLHSFSNYKHMYTDVSKIGQKSGLVMISNTGELNFKQIVSVVFSKYRSLSNI